MRDGWKDTTLSEVLTISRDRVDPSRLEPDYELIHWSIPQLDETSGPSTETASEIGSHKFAVLKDSVVYSLLNPRIPRFAKIAGGNRVVCSTEFAVLQPDSSLSLDFLYCFVTSPNFQEQVRSLAKGTTKSRERIDNKEINKLNFKLPPLPEQKRIVDLISSVDSYIEALKQQLENVKRSRNALLHELLNAGGDDWVETPIGDVAQVLSGFAFKSELFNKSEGIPLIRIRDLPKKDSTEALYSGSYEDRYIVKKGDFLIGMDGEFHCYEWSGPDALLNQRVCRIQDFKISRVLPRYIYFAVNQYLDKIEQDTGYTTVKHISAKQVLGITIPLPPLPEQKRIVEIINTIDEVIYQTELTTNKTQNLRSGLLSDLLSGEHEIPASYDKVIGAA